MKEYAKSGTYVRGDVEFPFNYNTSISASQKVSFVKNVVDIAVGENYYDFLVDIMFDYEVIDKFTDIDLFDVDESTDQLSAIESLLKDTNIVNTVSEDMDTGLLAELRESVEKCVEYRTGIHRNVVGDAIASIIGTIDGKISDFDFDSLVGSAKALSSISGELTADKILEAYANSDMYKKQRAQMGAGDKEVKKTKKRTSKSKQDNMTVIDGGANKENQTPVLSPTYEV